MLDDDFAHDLGSFDTLDALTEQLRMDLMRQAEQEADGQTPQRYPLGSWPHASTARFLKP